MQTRLSEKSIRVLSIFISLAGGICFAALILFNITSFYEIDPKQQILIFVAAAIVLSIFLFFCNRTFIIPYRKSIISRKTVIFLAIMTVILTGAFSLGAKHYWEMPIVNRVEICFDADAGSGSLFIDEIIDPNTNRQYSPFSFSDARYPITIDSGECIQGNIVNMITRSYRWWIVPRLKFLIKTTPPDGRFYVSINDVPSVVYFDKDSEEPFTSEVIIDEGFDQGEKLTIPWHKAWFFGLKAGGLLLGAIYLSVLFFGLTEKIITYSKIQTIK
jgi:hypothetical protein